MNIRINSQIENHETIIRSIQGDIKNIEKLLTSNIPNTNSGDINVTNTNSNIAGTSSPSSNITAGSGHAVNMDDIVTRQ